MGRPRCQHCSLMTTPPAQPVRGQILVYSFLFRAFHEIPIFFRVLLAKLMLGKRGFEQRILEFIWLWHRDTYGPLLFLLLTIHMSLVRMISFYFLSILLSNLLPYHMPKAVHVVVFPRATVQARPAFTCAQVAVTRCQVTKGLDLMTGHGPGGRSGVEAVDKWPETDWTAPWHGATWPGEDDLRKALPGPRRAQRCGAHLSSFVPTLCLLVSRTVAGHHVFNQEFHVRNSDAISMPNPPLLNKSPRLDSSHQPGSTLRCHIQPGRTSHARVFVGASSQAGDSERRKSDIELAACRVPPKPPPSPAICLPNQPSNAVD
ncbi:hypothetical protein K402DRAFT_239726 [Aulographum hederae CBS 113979]|uniref:Uncharacterized protein n=1 Tax=Aulographum hederae CBS 113979 TaxID=1176131 RepID=A0A6G1GK95_9PEZI|nr:hypothetical protein K402DRAFT_239726 [Aulographum hederae CBS 113979]